MHDEQRIERLADGVDAALGELQTALAPLTDTPVALSLQAPP